MTDSSSPIQRPWNTVARGIIEFVIFYDKKAKHFVGVCLSFDIIEEGNNPEKLMESLTDAAKLHVAVVKKENLPEALLNRYAPKKYWDKYLQVQGSTVLQTSLSRNLIANSVTSTTVSQYPIIDSNDQTKEQVHV